MNQFGLSEEETLLELKNRLKNDLSFESGRILGSMCTAPHSITHQIIHAYLEKNIGDPGLFPSTVELEREAVQMLGNFFRLDPAFGSIVTGGTEANILALWTAKETAPSHIREPEVIVPESAHFSFDKAQRLLNLKLVKIPLNEFYQMDLQALKAALTNRTIGLAAVAGTTSLGVVDPLEEIARIAFDNQLYFHVDAAFGGFVLPFLEKNQGAVPKLSFTYPGISSVTIDPHKMGMAPIPSGSIIYATEELARKVKVPVPYLSGGEASHATMVGTRSGASVLAVWALLKHLGRSGYQEIVSKAMALTHYLVDQIKTLEEYDIIIPPTLNVVGIISKKIRVEEFAEKLRKKGWAISLFKTHIRIVLMPHVKKEHIDHFISDLKLL